MLTELRRRERLLFDSAIAALLGGVIALLAAAVDPHQILGISRWIKPAKFFLSMAIYLATLAWMFSLLERPVRYIRGLIVISMFVEIVCITGQSLRGKQSHFNVETLLDLVVFNTMGGFILLNSICVAILLRLFFRVVSIERPLLVAIRLGLLVFLAGSFEAVFMLMRNAHTVGAADGGPGLPLVNWSTAHGDLRIAHFLGLHALQAFPLAALVLRRVSLVVVFAIAYLAVIAWLLFAALNGRPLVGL
jgi:hypothetical protein